MGTGPTEPQPFSLARWAGGFALASLIFIAGALNLGLTLMGASLTSFLLTTAAAFSVVPLYAYLILWLDRHEREPGWLLLAGFLWGATVAYLFGRINASILDFIVKRFFGPWMSPLVIATFAAPLVEETAKGAAVLLIALLWRHEFNGVLDGIVYGALVGLGFAAVENVDYFLHAFEGGGLQGLAVLFYTRALVGGLGHSGFTACTGAGLGYARESRTLAARAGAPLLGLTSAMFLHFSWLFTFVFLEPWLSRLSGGNFWVLLFVVLPFTLGVLQAPAWVTLGAIAYLSWKREASLVRAELAGESEVVAEEELPVLLSPRRRFRCLWRALVRGGVGAWRDLRAYYDLAVDFAFAKHDAGRGERSLQELERYRARLREVRDRLAARAVDLC